MKWEACPPSLSGCVLAGSGGELSTWSAGSGTVFRITGGDGSTGLSPVWHGNVVSLTPPSVTGTVRANELVRPIPGLWEGGWEGEGDFLQLAACPRRQGTTCTTLTDSHYVGSCPETSAVIDPAFIGDYLRVANQRRGAGPHYGPRYAAGSPYQARGGVWRASPTTSVAVIGRIAAPIGPRTEDCGFPSLNKASISKSGVASVHCYLGCRAVLHANRGGREVRVVRKLNRRRLRLNGRSHRLRLSPQSARYLGVGLTYLTVWADGTRLAQRDVVLHAGSGRNSRPPG
jgi:hypothetical protein